MATEESDRSRDALERLAAAAERAERASEANTIQNLKDTAVAKELAEAEKAAAKAAATFKAGMDAAGGAAGNLADSFITYNKEVYKGSSANQAAAASMEKMGEAAKYAGAFLAILVPGGPIVKALVAGLGLLAKSAMEAGAEVARHTDSVYKAYQDMAKIGATGAGGMQDVFNSLQKVGLGTQKFGEYLKLVNDNSKDLALFSGTVLQGRKIFENTMESLTDQQKIQMEQMGLNDSARAEVTMNYIKQQRLLTLGTKTQMDTSSTAVMKYIKETDELTRITGLNRQEQEKALEIAMANEAFQATIIDMQDRGLHESAEVAKKMHAVAYSISPQKGAEFAASLSEFGASTKLGGQAYMSSAGESAEVSRKLLAGEIKNSEQGMAAMERLYKAQGDTAKIFRTQAAMSNFGDNMGNLNDILKAEAMAKNGLVKNFEQAEKDLKNATEGDPLGKAQAKTAVDTQATQLELQRNLNELMPGYIKEAAAAAEQNRILAKTTMDDLTPAFDKLWKALVPMIAEIGKLMAKHVLPALVTSITKLAEVVSGIPDIISGPLTEEDTKKEADLKSRDKANRANMTLGESMESGLTEGVENIPRFFGAITRFLGADSLGSGLTRIADKAQESRVTSEREELARRGRPVPEPRAAGGPVSSKTPYLVGEEGPEIFVPSVAGDIIPTGKLQGTTGAALKQRDEIEKLVDQIVVNIKQQKTISDTDLKREKEYSNFYKDFISVKTKFEKDQLEAINYQLTEGSSGAAGAGGGGGSGLKMPSMPGIAGMGGGQGLRATRQDDLSKMGLNIKTGDVQAEGAGISPRLIELARQIQGGVPGFNYFSAFNDKFHQETASGSQHAKGLALDFTVANNPSIEDGKKITDWLKGLGASLAIDEYNNPSSRSTAGHFHAQIPGFEDGGTLGAGRIGIAGEGGKPELISGPASITPMNDLMGALNSLNAHMERSISTLDEIARISKATSDSSAKMLSYAQN